MTNKLYAIVLGLLFVFSAAWPLSAADEKREAPTPPSEWKYEHDLSITARTLSPIDNQDTVREYDRNAYRALDISRFSLQATDRGGNTANFLVKDLLSSGWADGYFDWHGPYVSLNLSSEGLFHRLAQFNQNWVVNGVRIIAPTGTTATTGTVNLANLNPSDSYFQERRENELKLKVGRFDQVRFVAGFWSEKDNGRFQLWTKDFTAADYEHPQTSRTWSLDRNTSQLEVGLEGPIMTWPFSYRYQSSTFSDGTPGLSLGAFWLDNGADGLKQRGQGSLMFPSFKSNAHRFTLATPDRENLAASAHYVVRTRDNTVTGYRYRLGTFRANGFWQPHHDWSLSGSFYSNEKRTDMNSGWVAPDTANLALGFVDLDQQVYRLDARYHGWKWGSFGVGYKVERDRRRNDALSNDLDKAYGTMLSTYRISPLDPLNFAQENSKRTWTIDFMATPTSFWNFSAHYSSQTAPVDDYTRGVTGNNNDLTADLSFVPNPKQLYYINYNSHLGKSAQFSFENKISSLLAGLWFDYQKWGLGLSYGAEDQDTTSWIYWAGWRPKPAAIPAATVHMFTPERDTYTSRNQTWTVNTRVPLSTRFSLDAAYTSTNSRGTQPLTLFTNLQNLYGAYVNAGINGGGFTNVVSEENPVDVLWTQFNAGLDFILNAQKSRIRLDWFSGQWRDGIDPTLTGSYNSLWLTGQKKF
ncbi:MAG: hypothetical protein HYU64_15680 [Armatimonadetes bacterium]|nr:hypothetical protein [Armatimonadota bacterium]